VLLVAVDIMLLSLLAVSALLFLLVVAACAVGILNGTPVIIEVQHHCWYHCHWLAAFIGSYAYLTLKY